MDAELKKQISKVITKHAFNESYEPSDKYEQWDGVNPMTIHTMPDLIKHLKESETTEIDARVYCHNKESGKAHLKKLGKSDFLEAVASDNVSKIRFKESADYFQNDYDVGGNLVGEDFIPLLGGPFNKQLYYVDYIKQAMSAFFAYHSDPFARRVIQTYKNFTLGKGFRVDCENKTALAAWKAFERVNKIQEMMEYIAIEAPINGETMVYWVPNGDKDYYYQTPEQMRVKVLIPRIKLIDPTTVWDIVTQPENFEPIFYQQIYPTQYQLFGTNDAPTSKFIYQQLPAERMQHWKLNSVSNEKRGRSDLFPILGYLKRLRDTINYKVIAEQKNAAWAIDTTIKGSQQDLQAYTDSMQALGTIPEAGSEFVHTDAIERQYLSSNAASGGKTESFEQVVSMICVGSGLTVNYFGTHIGGSSSRASAITSTEPVAKLFEMRQAFYERILLDISRKFFEYIGINDAELEISFPEVITPDRSQKLQDLAVAESQGWFSKKRCAEIGAKELGVTDFDFEKEKKEMEESKPVMGSPLAVNPEQNTIAKPNMVGKDINSSRLTGQDKQDIRANGQNL